MLKDKNNETAYIGSRSRHIVFVIPQTPFGTLGLSKRNIKKKNKAKKKENVGKKNINKRITSEVSYAGDGSGADIASVRLAERLGQTDEVHTEIFL